MRLRFFDKMVERKLQMLTVNCSREVRSIQDSFSGGKCVPSQTERQFCDILFSPTGKFNYLN
jgi:hypothetical protein